MADYRSLSDQELIRLLQTSEHAAFNEIYRRYFELLYTHAYKKLSDKDVAKDIIQEVFAALWLKRDATANIKDLAAYLFSSVRYKIFDYFAHVKVRENHLESLKGFLTEKPIVSTDYQIREAQFRAYIDQQIQALPPKMRLVFEMSRKQELSYREIAEQLSTTENNISKQINNALRVLRTKLNIFFSITL